MIDAPYTTVAPLLVVEFSGGDAELSWDAATSSHATVTEYQVYRSTDGVTYELLGTVDPHYALEFTDTPEDVGTYWYYVLAMLEVIHVSSMVEDEAAFDLLFGSRIRGINETIILDGCAQGEVLPTAPPSVVPHSGRVK